MLCVEAVGLEIAEIRPSLVAGESTEPLPDIALGITWGKVAFEEVLLGGKSTFLVACLLNRDLETCGFAGIGELRFFFL